MDKTLSLGEGCLDFAVETCIMTAIIIIYVLLQTLLCICCNCKELYYALFFFLDGEERPPSRKDESELTESLTPHKSPSLHSSSSASGRDSNLAAESALSGDTDESATSSVAYRQGKASGSEETMAEILI